MAKGDEAQEDNQAIGALNDIERGCFGSLAIFFVLLGIFGAGAFILYKFLG